jgi:hypothetical protein
MRFDGLTGATLKRSQSCRAVHAAAVALVAVLSTAVMQTFRQRLLPQAKYFLSSRPPPPASKASILCRPSSMNSVRIAAAAVLFPPSFTRGASHLSTGEVLQHPIHSSTPYRSPPAVAASRNCGMPA